MPTWGGSALAAYDCPGTPRPRSLSPLLPWAACAEPPGLCGAAGCVLDPGWTGGTSRDCRYREQTPEGGTGGDPGDVIVTVCSAPPAGDYEKPSL